MNYTTKTIIWWFLTISVPKKFKKFIFEIPRIAQVLNINNLRTTSAMSINLQTIRKLIEYSLEIVLVKTMFTLTVFEILLSQGRSVLWPAQQVIGSKRVKVSVKNQKNIRNLLKLLEQWLIYKLWGFWMVFNFMIFFNPFSPGRFEKFDLWDANNCANFKHK